MFSRIKKFLIEYKELRQMAYYDSLTGLRNRNWLDKNLQNIKRSYVCFIDINKLHRINKKYGHSYGDMYIISVIQKLIGSLRDNDILIRYGGDEFLLFCNSHDQFISNTVFSVGKSSTIGINNKEAIDLADLNLRIEKYKTLDCRI